MLRIEPPLHLRQRLTIFVVLALNRRLSGKRQRFFFSPLLEGFLGDGSASLRIFRHLPDWRQILTPTPRTEVCSTLFAESVGDVGRRYVEHRRYGASEREANHVREVRELSAELHVVFEDVVVGCVGGALNGAMGSKEEVGGRCIRDDFVDEQSWSEVSVGELGAVLPDLV
jgi:hypothetical protein